MLAKMGYHADVVNNGREALLAMQKVSYDVILMDSQMPEMNGEEATQRIRAELPADRQPHIIALTASAMKDDRERYLAAGMDDCLSKPVRGIQLQQALLRCPVSSYEGVSAATEPAEVSPPDEAALAEPPAPLPPVEPLAYPVTGDNGRELELDVIDYNLLETYWNPHNFDILIDVIDIFKEEAPGQLSDLRQAIETGDFKLLHFTAHKLKSSSLNFGAARFSQLCTQLEEMAEAEILDGAMERLIEIETRFVQVVAGLEKLQEQHAQNNKDG
jgi:CheY-like chemotaxis protein/HPt (histidine-containing phosphotransfer) domain-containing protein